MPTPSTLFGLPLLLNEDESEKLTDFLNLTWWSNYGKSTINLDDDLKLMSRYFDPIITGRKLRDHISSVSRLSRNAMPSLDVSLLVVSLWDDRYLLRPEGRIVLDLLNGSSGESEFVIFEPNSVLSATYKAFEYYRNINQKRLIDVVDLLSGKEGLQSQSIGLLLWLLINRCDDPGRAIQIQYDNPVYIDRINEVLSIPIEAFNDSIGRSNVSRKGKLFSIYSAWQLTEISRRLGKRINTGKSLYLSPGSESDVIDLIVTSLQSPGRKVDLYQLDNALSDFYDAFKDSVPRLAALSIYHEYSFETTRIFSEIKTRFRHGSDSEI